MAASPWSSSWRACCLCTTVSANSQVSTDFDIDPVGGEAVVGHQEVAGDDDQGRLKHQVLPLVFSREQVVRLDALNCLETAVLVAPSDIDEDYIGVLLVGVCEVALPSFGPHTFGRTCDRCIGRACSCRHAIHEKANEPLLRSSARVRVVRGDEGEAVWWSAPPTARMEF